MLGELEFGATPGNADTDYDNINDGAELQYWNDCINRYARLEFTPSVR